MNWERALGIHTEGEDESRADRFHSPHQPTDYRVLERLAGSGLIGRDDLLIDYGSGLGRVGIFLSHVTRCRSLGVEYDERLYARALRNAAGHPRTAFALERAERFTVPPDANRFYFFNPFPEMILSQVLRRIGESLEKAPREVRLLAYFPVDGYARTLGACFHEQGEIDCRDLFGGHDERERILIFE